MSLLMMSIGEDNIKKKIDKLKGAILSFQLIKQVYDLSICKEADGTLHAAISLETGSLMCEFVLCVPHAEAPPV